MARVCKFEGGLPKFIDLSFYKIEIRQVGKRRMRDEDESEPDQETPEGIWDPDNDTIFIGRWLSAKRKRQVMLHELIHAALDCWEQENYV